jgi:hypothetical protein
MRRRNFIAGCASGIVAATVLRAENRISGEHAQHVAALIACKEHEVSGNVDQFVHDFHTDCLRVEPGTLRPITGRQALADAQTKSSSERKLVYFYYRQPQVVVAGNYGLVICNYEAGYDAGGQIIEESGKASHILLSGGRTPTIALQMEVPNIYHGSYGALGTAITSPHLGIFPVRGLGPQPNADAQGAGGGEKDALYTEVQRINNAWLAGRTNDVLRNASKSGVFLIGDYSPFYITGTNEVKHHFDDFYKTSRVNAIQSQDPTVRVWGDSAAVYFNFNLDYNLGGKPRKAPGRGVYTFTRNTGAKPGAPKALTVCAASHLVNKEVGDPYPQGGNS